MTPSVLPVGGSGVSTTQGWTYNGLDLLAHHSHARSSGQSPLVVSWGYDAGLAVKGYVNGIPMVKTVGYAPSGALTAYTTGLGIGKDVTTAIAQDAQLVPRPSSITTSGATVNFATGGYSYDGAGNIKAMGAVDSFGYDLRSRLLSATLSNPQGGTVSQSMSYDRYGNLLTKGATTYSVNAANNRLTTASYDARGNVTGNGGDIYAYDGLDRMEYNRSGGTDWDYVYGAEGERIAKIPPLGATWTLTFRDEGKRVSTEYAGTTPSRDNVYLGSLLVASYANGAVGGNGSVWTYYASDHLGTPRLITDAGGTTVEQRKTYPYGEDLGTQGVFQRVKFAAMERDVEGASSATGGSRHQDHARSQEVNLGRFLSPDKLGGKAESPQTWNRYAYSRNNPVKLLDPNGLDFTVAATFANTTLNERQQVAILHGIGQTYAQAGVKNITIRLNGVTVFRTPFDAKAHQLGGDHQSRLEIQDHHKEVDTQQMRGLSPGLAPGLGEVSLTTAPAASPGREIFAINVGSHELGHTVGLSDSSSGVMDVPPRDKPPSDEIKQFAPDDARSLRLFLNGYEPPPPPPNPCQGNSGIPGCGGLEQH